MADLPPNYVTLKIDGQTLSVPRGTNVLEAARTVGVEVPYFCYHPGLSSPAVCRQCLVEVKGQPKLVPSCYTPVSENMEVSTASEKTLAARAQMLEFTLVNHPVDCPICDKAGECTLQKLYHEWDAAPSRIQHEKVHKPKVVDLGPGIVLDTERCILCTRCVRVCDEVAHNPQLTMAWRGDREQLTVAPGLRLDNPYSLNTVDVCPVGALTSKDFRFSMRAWELYTTPSVCTGCATGCNDEIHHAHGRIHRLIPRENAAVNKYWMCDEGRLTYHEISDRRVAGARVDGESAPLERALAFAAERLAALRGASASSELIGVVLSAQASNEDNWILLQAAKALGVARVYQGGRAPRPERADHILRHADVNPNSAGVRALAGATKSAADLAADLAAGTLKALWILGEDLFLDETPLAQLAKLDVCVVQAVRESPLTERASVVLPAAAWAETHGTVTNAKGLVQRLRAAVEPPGEARPHHELVLHLAKKLGLPLTYPNVKTIFAAMQKDVAAFADASFGKEALTVQLRFAGSRG